MKQDIIKQDIIKQFTMLKGLSKEEMLVEQISILENNMLAAGFQCEIHISYGIENDFYYKDEEDVVFVVYYNWKHKRPAYATMDKEVFNHDFRGTKKKLAFSIRNDKEYKVVVSMEGTYIPLCHLALGFNGKIHECVDHTLNNIWLNTSNFIRLCTQGENNCNRRNSRNKSGSVYDYNPAMDFRDNWWLIPLATMLHVISMEEAIEYNRRL